MSEQNDTTAHRPDLAGPGSGGGPGQPWPGAAGQDGARWAGAPGAAVPGWSWGPAATPPGPPAAPARVTAAVAMGAAGVLALGLVLAVFVASLVLRAGAEDLGRGLGEALGASPDGLAAEALAGIEDGGWDAYPPGTAIEQSEPVAPAGLGSDPALDAYAQECFTGLLQSCDDLYAESPPLSAYEEYATTCGGRVKAMTVYACTELD
ncbi:hypothetical protein [Modestobacter italicus]|uniref:hypothetical protein n=1 Tax=Modestobacter italicus (strain DSM 44449 / CECT 9708 / BC 501) TaxID=2732864 RepID=UPI001C93B441|nr:hypothetical protein [Modestobacter italicus]